MCNLSMTRGGGRRGGAAFEVLDDCRHDLAAWIAWLGDHVGSRLGLVGHSSGAVKCLYSQAHEPAETVRAIIALSPPRLSHSWFLQGEKAITFRDTILQAQSLLAVGEGNHLLDVHFPLPFVTTAAGYLEKYGTDERYNFLRFLDRLNVPTLLTFGGGEIESNVAFRDAPAAVAQVAPKIRVEVVPQADHFYSGLRQPLFEKLDKWLDSLS
ncbi:MAG: alpha/beta hydrolase family protein, partial [Gemmataceae bacterium]